MHIVVAKAVAFGEALKPEFRDYQQAVVDNARVLAEELQKHGLRIVSGGTDTHLMLVDLTSIDVTGQQAEETLESVHITVNKNAIPFDAKPPRVTSGLRLGTPATTSRGFGVKEMTDIARLIATALGHIGDEAALGRVREEAQSIAARFPVPGLDD
jgi:glycine hydroxymethyltransferase